MPDSDHGYKDFCYWCHKAWKLSDPPLNRCSHCKLVHYCNKECQSTDWKHHKEECKAIAEGRATEPKARMDIEALPEHGCDCLNNFQTPDTVYYIKTSVPHRREVSITGPYYPQETIATPIYKRLQAEKSGPGAHNWAHIIATQEPISLITHIRAALPKGAWIKFEILRHRNPEVAAFLRATPEGQPKPVYAVFVKSMDSGFHGGPGQLPVSDAYVHTVFTSKEAANQCAHEVLDQWKVEFPMALVDRVDQDGLVIGLLALSPLTGLHKVVTVHMDDGTQHTQNLPKEVRQRESQAVFHEVSRVVDEINGNRSV